MAKLENSETVGFLREVLKKRSVKLTALAEAIDIPYRSIQNYFSKNAMPLWVYERICSQVAIDPAFPIKKGERLINNRLLAEALLELLGKNLPAFCDEDLSFKAIEHNRSASELRRDAQVLAVLLAGRYDLIINRPPEEPWSAD